MHVIIGIVFFIVMSALLIFDSFVGEKDVAELRKQQTDSLKKENNIRMRFDEYTKQKVKYNKRYKMETLCMNAGYKDLKYSDVVLINMLSSFVMLFIFGVILNNIFLGIILGAVAWKVPVQILTAIKNKRITTLENQIGVFMNMVTKRYINTGDFEKSLVLTRDEFKGIEPMYGELNVTVAEVKVGISVGEAMDNLARRTGNGYMKRFADFYKIAYKLGTDEVREKLLTQAYEQFEENRKLKEFMKKEIAEPVRDSYIMVATIPIFFVFGAFAMPGYMDFMLFNILGKITMAVIVLIIIFSIWFINKKVAAPLDKHEQQE